MKIEPGVLAVVVDSKYPENVNRVVTVEAFDAPLSNILGGRWWGVECPTPLRCKDGSLETSAYVEESCLRPISGPSIAKHVRLWDELPREVTA